MGSSLTKNQLSELSVSELIVFLRTLEKGKYYDKYKAILLENQINGLTLVSLLDETHVELFLLEMGIDDVKQRVKLIEILTSFDHEGSIATLDSQALSNLLTTAELKQKGETASKLKDAGYTALELIEGGFPLKEVLACGYSSAALNEAHYVTRLIITNIFGVDGIYDGICKRNKPHGEGTCTYKNGDWYEGYWCAGLKSGEGRAVSEREGVTEEYQGHWLDDMMHGHGVLTTTMDNNNNNNNNNNNRTSKSLKHCGTYIGEFQCNKKNGEGKFSSVEGFVYNGEYLNDLKHGQGTLCFANGDIYTGSFYEDQMHGKGSLVFQRTRTKYIGNFFFDNMWGKGKIVGEEGLVYDGNFKDNKKHGYGRLQYVNGDVYDGSFANDKKHGRGRYTWADGDIYEGNYYCDRRNDSNGKMICSDGATFEAFFKNDLVIIPRR